ncbi:hypothetical protein T11_2231 [Trichinella zimbabwensis]|uniref:PiggyBac transposable element-derived protein domain-containing protein n=1 Tax=Trichinella zimbabwensis TaxID=268475 RepID=A0A0V1HX99_9BILA|nr:hypothetical protein T11_2231 [Trichinella zimbabwensis]
MLIFDLLLLSGYRTEELKSTGRSAFDFRTGAKNKIIAVGWFGNRCVTVTSTHLGVKSKSSVRRWDSRQNMLVALFRVDRKSQKHRIFLPIISNAITNVWQLYKRHSKLIY